MKLRLILIFICCYGSFFSQDQGQKSTLKCTGMIIDSFTMEPCPYVRVYNLSTKTGVLTEFNGRFELPPSSPNDSISFFSTGYKQRFIVAKQLLNDSIVYLSPEANAIDEVIILANDNHLYRWFSQVFDRKQPVLQAKTYFQLESYVNQTQVELLEAYYNASVQGSKITDLDYKSSRVAVGQTDQMSFVSTETSKAILQLNLNEKNDFLPQTPFDYSTKKMRRAFKLQLNQTYKNTDDHAIFVISFRPKDPSISSFSGTIWIDTVTKQAQKLVLTATNTQQHPFLPLWPSDSIVSVDMEINYLFKEVESGTVIDFLYYDYQLLYQNRDKDFYTVKTAVVVHPYNYDSTFFIPRFEGPISRLSDYRKTQAYPYNKAFWRQIEHPISQENSEANALFFEQQSRLQNLDSLSQLSNTTTRKGFFESPCLVWGERRIGIINDLESKEINVSAPPSSQYQLVVQVLLDLNNYNGKVIATTTTILDPFQTFYHLKVEPSSQCFLNLYFDLVEMERRKFMQEIEEKNLSTKQILELYEAMKTQITTLSDRFFKETDHGLNRKAMEKWNAIVQKELGIDNVAFFRLYEEE